MTIIIIRERSSKVTFRNIVGLSKKCILKTKNVIHKRLVICNFIFIRFFAVLKKIINGSGEQSDDRNGYEGRG